VLVIGTQSPDHALMSQLVDYAKAIRSGSIEDATFSGHIFEIPEELDVFDEANWPLANPAIGDFRSLEDMRILAERAKRMPTLEASFRNLFLQSKGGCGRTLDTCGGVGPMSRGN
jgi:phage terminase large subunit-like protein